jgi:hypothetical protein
VRGVSLIEALVALAVMAFGMLGVVGMQSSLRGNADVSRQRGEAMRLAQEEMERWRNHSCLLTAECPGELAFEDIEDTGPEALVVPETNTTFTRSTDVTPEAAGAPRLRLVTVTVGWTDRRGEAQSVVLTTQIGYVPRELGALPALRADRGPLSQPSGRNPLIPRGATPYDATRSRFDPPGGGGLGWLFNNESGLIVGTCPPPPSTTCTVQNRQLVSGGIGFALAATAPGPAASDAELPVSVMPTAMTVAMQVRYVLPSPAGTEACFTSESSDRRRVSYYCAVPVTGLLQWRGTVDPLITVSSADARSADTYPSTSPLPASSAAGPTDATATRYRVCRYTPVNVNRRVLPGGYTEAELLAHNNQHPWQYFFAKGPYTDRNFLVIRAGDGSTVFQCPTEDTSTAIQSNTFHHPRLP